MTNNPYDVPGAGVLIKSECVGRLGSVIGAVREPSPSASSVSRCMSPLERQLSVRLLERPGSGERLTDAGRRYHDTVTGAFAALRSGAGEAAELSRRPGIIIACSHDASRLLIDAATRLSRICWERTRAYVF